MNSDVVLVALDDASKLVSGYEYLWPYDYYAETVKKITDGGPAGFGMDILFTNTVDTVGWSRLIDELAVSYMAVNPYSVDFGSIKEPFELNIHNDEILDELKMNNLSHIGPMDGKHVINIGYKTSSELMEVSSGVGFIDIEPDLDGVLRRIPLVAEVNGMLAPHFI
ncbi:CHASE2 domain-containing protein, partial [Candidatus Pelagibacter communis]|uniref:CHASE2 domain-containing protein n=1 Tax=Pelagibacter ubique TaxID=198252 RepID=UPI0011775E00